MSSNKYINLSHDDTTTTFEGNENQNLKMKFLDNLFENKSKCNLNDITIINHTDEDSSWIHEDSKLICDEQPKTIMWPNLLIGIICSLIMITFIFSFNLKVICFLLATTVIIYLIMYNGIRNFNKNILSLRNLIARKNFLANEAFRRDYKLIEF